jgi:transposase
VVIELREWSRIAEGLGAERNRLTNRMREQLCATFPHCSSSKAISGRSGCSICGRPFRRQIRPRASARRQSPSFSSGIASAASTPLIQYARRRPVQIAAGTTEAASAHFATLIARIRLVNQQLVEPHRRLDILTARLVPTEEVGQRKQHDVEILASLPGVGRIVLATLLAEAFDALHRRDYAALRSLTGVAPVTKRSAPC